jgi:hypothetical protein
MKTKMMKELKKDTIRVLIYFSFCDCRSVDAVIRSEQSGERVLYQSVIWQSAPSQSASWQNAFSQSVLNGLV